MHTGTGASDYCCCFTGWCSISNQCVESQLRHIQRPASVIGVEVQDVGAG